MNPLTIASIGAMLGGAYMTKKANDDAARRQAEAIRRGLENQRRLRSEAEQKAMDLAKNNFTPNDRVENQAKIEDEINRNLIAPVERGHIDFSKNLGTSGNVSKDYNNSKAQSDLNVLKTSRDLARIMSKVSSADRLRMNEGVNMMDTGREIDMLHNFSRGQQGVDEMATARAGIPNSNTLFMGNVLGMAGQAGLMRGANAGNKQLGWGDAPVYDRSSTLQQPKTYGFGINPYKKSSFSLT